LLHVLLFEQGLVIIRRDLGAHHGRDEHDGVAHIAMANSIGRCQARRQLHLHNLAGVREG
jgi:hypothetical protein